MSKCHFFCWVIVARLLDRETSQARLGRPKPTQVCMAHPCFARISLFLHRPGCEHSSFGVLRQLVPRTLLRPYIMALEAGGVRQKSSLVLMWCDGDD